MSGSSNVIAPTAQDEAAAAPSKSEGSPGGGDTGEQKAWPPLRTPSSAVSQFLRRDENIQGNILAGFNKDQAVFFLLSFPTVEVGRRWLNQVLPHVATTKAVAQFNDRFSAARRDGRSDPTDLAARWTNVSLTGEGFKLLAPDAVASLEARRSTLERGIVFWLDGAAHQDALQAIGDIGENDPAHWVFGSEDDHIHAVVCIAADNVDDLALDVARQHETAASLGYRIVFEQPGATLPGDAAGHEHFGFRDGISQPGVTNFDSPDPAEPDQVAGKPGTDLVAPGTFILGYERDEAPAISVPRWMWDGSFLVTRRLAQDVPGFWSNMEEAHKTLSGSIVTDPATGIPTADALAARLVGRWRSGTPTDRRPVADQRSAQDPRLDNKFDFGSDLEGVTTPHASHIRKVYPRAGATGIGVTEKNSRHRRILRRGIPYGPPFGPAGGRGSGVETERGLLFQCYQASIADQFVFLQETWINNDSFAQGGAGKDAVIGLDSTVTLEGGDATAEVHFAQWVKTRGSIFSLTPSIPTLKAIAAGQPLAEDDPLFVSAALATRPTS